MDYSSLVGLIDDAIVELSEQSLEDSEECKTLTPQAQAKMVQYYRPLIRSLKETRRLIRERGLGSAAGLT